MSPVMTGPSSRVTDSTTTVATAPSAANRLNDGQRKVADIDYFAQDRAKIERRRQRSREGKSCEDHQPAGTGEETEENCAHRGKEPEHQAGALQ
jgi:hypothetical protein